MMFRRRSSVSHKQLDLPFEPSTPSSPGSNLRSPPLTPFPVTPGGTALSEICAPIQKALADMARVVGPAPDNDLGKAVLALQKIFDIYTKKGKLFQVQLLGEKVTLSFQAVFDGVYGPDVDTPKAYMAGITHYEVLHSELERSLRELTSSRNPSSDLIQAALTKITVAITRVPSELEKERRALLGKGRAD